MQKKLKIRPEVKMKNIIVERSEAKDQWFVKEDGLIVRVEYSEEAATREAEAFVIRRDERARMIAEAQNVKS